MKSLPSETLSGLSEDQLSQLMVDCRTWAFAKVLLRAKCLANFGYQAHYVVQTVSHSKSGAVLNRVPWILKHASGFQMSAAQAYSVAIKCVVVPKLHPILFRMARRWPGVQYADRALFQEVFLTAMRERHDELLWWLLDNRFFGKLETLDVVGILDLMVRENMPRLLIGLAERTLVCNDTDWSYTAIAHIEHKAKLWHSPFAHAILRWAAHRRHQDPCCMVRMTSGLLGWTVPMEQLHPSHYASIDTGSSVKFPISSYIPAWMSLHEDIKLTKIVMIRSFRIRQTIFTSIRDGIASVFEWDPILGNIVGDYACPCLCEVYLSALEYNHPNDKYTGRREVVGERMTAERKLLVARLKRRDIGGRAMSICESISESTEAVGADPHQACFPW